MIIIFIILPVLQEETQLVPAKFKKLPESY